MKEIILTALILVGGSWERGEKHFSQLEPRFYKSLSICKQEKQKYLATFKEYKEEIKKYYNVTAIKLRCKKVDKNMS